MILLLINKESNHNLIHSYLNHIHSFIHSFIYSLNLNYTICVDIIRIFGSLKSEKQHTIFYKLDYN